MNKLIVFITVFLQIGCATIFPASTSLDSPLAKYEIFPEDVNTCSAENASMFRSPAGSELICSKVLLDGGQSSFVNPLLRIYTAHIAKDFAKKSQLEKMRAQLVEQNQLKSPIPISDAAAGMRAEILPIMKMGFDYAEGLVRVMEVDLRQQSFRLKKQLSQQAPSNSDSTFDHVVIGFGVHGIIATSKILRDNPNAKILIVDSTDTPAATFRSASDMFRINSSSRPSGEGYRPLPGEGNLNQLPELPIQVTDLSASKYPTSGDLGRALVAGAYANVTSHPNVKLLLQTDVERVSKNDNGTTEYRLAVKFQDGQTEHRVVMNTSSVVIAGGLGLPGYPKEFVDFLSKNPRFLTSRDPAKQLPKVMTFEDVFRTLAASDNPRKFFEGKKVDVIGTGDSANVLIEFLLGYAPDAAYGKSDGQNRPVDMIRWIGQSAKTCEQFIKDARSRYAQIGTGFRSSSPNTPAILQGIPAKAATLTPKGPDNFYLKLEDGQLIGDSDVIIVATGFQGQLHKVLGDVVPGFSNDKAMMESLPFIEAATSTSDKPTRVGKYIRGSQDGNSIVVVGPSAGPLATQAELVGVIQNFVSIFNNAPRTVSAVATAFVRRMTSSNTASAPAAPLRLQEATERQSILVRDIESSRSLNSTLPDFIATSFRAFLRGVEVPSMNDGVLRFEISYQANARALLFEGESRVDIVPLVESMASTRDFLSQIGDVLKPYGGGYRIEVEVPVSGARVNENKLRVKYTQVRSSPSLIGAVEVNNAPLDLRGLRQVNLEKFRPQEKKVETETTVANTRPVENQPQKRSFTVGESVYVGKNLGKVTAVEDYLISVQFPWYSGGRSDKYVSGNVTRTSGSFNGFSVKERVSVGDSVGEILGFREGGIFTVKYDTGEIDYRVKASQLKKVNSTPAKPADSAPEITRDSFKLEKDELVYMGDSPGRITAKLDAKPASPEVTRENFSLNINEVVYVGNKQGKVVGFPENNLVRVKFESGAEVNFNSIYLVKTNGTFSGFSANENVYVGAARAKIIGFNNIGVYTVRFNDGRISNSISRDDLAKTSGSSQGFVIGENVYIGDKSATLVGLKGDSGAVVRLFDEKIVPGVKLTELAKISGERNGFTVGESVFLESKYADIVGVKNNGEFVVRLFSGQIVSGVGAASLAKTTGTLNGIAIKEVVYIGKESADVVGFTSGKGYVVRFFNGKIESGVPASAIAQTKGSVDGYSVRENVYYKGEPVTILAIKPDKTLVIRFYDFTVQSGIRLNMIGRTPGR